MEYNDAMRYLMEGVREQQEKETATEVYDAEYEKDYLALTQLEADLEVYNKKYKDFQKMKAEENENFEKMVKKLAELQIKKDELNSLSWAKICSVFSGKYEKRRAELDNDSLFAQVEMNSVKMNLQNLDRQLMIMKNLVSETKKAYNANRKYMKAKYGEEHRYEQEREHKNSKLKILIKEIDEALAAIDRLNGHGEKAVDYMDSADTWAIATDMISAFSFVGAFVSDTMTASRESDARDQMFLINSMLPTVVKEIEDVIEAYRAFRREYEDENPENDLENPEDMDPPIEFIRINTVALKDRRMYYAPDLEEIFCRLGIVKTNLRKERTIANKMIKK